MKLHRLAFCFAAAASAALAASLPPIPDTPKKPIVDVYHGVSVTDNYRWLENNNDPAVKSWIDAQNTRTRAYFDAVPHRAEISSRISELVHSNSVQYVIEVQRDGTYFGLKIDPHQQQPTLIALKDLAKPDEARTIVDPNRLDAKGGIEIDWAVVSLDGKKVGVSLSSGGSEAGDLHLYDVATGEQRGEVIPHVQNGTAGGSGAFNPDGSGFWYTRYPRGHEHAPEDAGLFQQVWYHRLGTKTEDDTYELGRDLPKIAEIALQPKEDGKYILAEVKNGDGGEVAFYLRSVAPKAAWHKVSGFEDKVFLAEFGRDDALYLVSRADAPRGKVLRLPLSEDATLAQAKEIIPQGDGAIQTIVATDHRLYITDLLGGPSRVRITDLNGKSEGELPILPVSSVYGIVRTQGDNVVFSNGSYLYPPAWYSYDSQSKQAAKTALAVTSIADYSDCEVVRDYAPSKGGTRVPLDVIQKKGTARDGHNATILYAFGGYGVSMTPSFSASRRAWLDQGGVYVIANIRGGGEYGDEWHLNGNLLKKQNDYDDFYACAQWLVSQHYTTPDHLAIMGGSNGGLLMGAALTQHPEEYRAVASMVGVYDMLRVELTQNGRFNVTEYGTVKDEAQFKALYGYSPYHHVVDGTKYPAILLTTGANDPRVDPWHSRKFAARLQAATASDHPILLRTSFSAGHGIGSSLNETIALLTDVYTFLFNELGVQYQPVAAAHQ